VAGPSKSSSSHKSKKGDKKSSEKDKYPGIECRISNWKIASYGSPLHDVAFLFLTSLAPDVREVATPKLLQYYYQVFKVKLISRTKP
jgi:hypothetical protein